jgi:hypothetical protein
VGQQGIQSAKGEGHPAAHSTAGTLQLRSSKNWVTSPSVKVIFMDSQSLSQVFENPKTI